MVEHAHDSHDRKKRKREKQSGEFCAQPDTPDVLQKALLQQTDMFALILLPSYASYLSCFALPIGCFLWRIPS